MKVPKHEEASDRHCRRLYLDETRRKVGVGSIIVKTICQHTTPSARDKKKNRSSATHSTKAAQQGKLFPTLLCNNLSVR